MPLLWKRTIKHAEELLPTRASPHEAYDGVEMLRKRRMPNIARKPLVMPRLAGTALCFGVYLLKLLDKAGGKALVNEVDGVFTDNARLCYGQWIKWPPLEPEHLLVELIRKPLSPSGKLFCKVPVENGLQRLLVSNLLVPGGFINKRSDTDASNTAQDEFALLGNNELRWRQGTGGIVGSKVDFANRWQNICLEAFALPARWCSELNGYQYLAVSLGNDGKKVLGLNEHREVGTTVLSASPCTPKSLHYPTGGDNSLTIGQNVALNFSIPKSQGTGVRGVLNFWTPARLCRALGDLGALLRSQFLGPRNTTGHLRFIFGHACILLLAMLACASIHEMKVQA